MEIARTITVEVLPKFRVGDIVIMSAFTDSDGLYHPDTPPLTVATVRVIRSESTSSHRLADYVRIMAYGPGLSSYEGAERFFRHAGQEE